MEILKLISIFLHTAPAPVTDVVLPERYYQDHWCRQWGGQAEVRLGDKTRVDCLTATHAIEVDFGPKWAEALGQSLYYAHETGKQAGIVLVMKRKEERYAQRLNRIIQQHKLPVTVWRASTCWRVEFFPIPTVVTLAQCS